VKNILIKNGWIFNGRSESIPFKADLLIENGIIKAIGENLSNKKVEQIINAEDKIISPGFIDLNSCLDSSYGSSSIWDDSFLIRQGITTAIMGAKGVSAIDYLFSRKKQMSLLLRGGLDRKRDGFFLKYNKTPLTINVSSFLGWETAQEQGITNSNKLRDFFSTFQHKVMGFSFKICSHNQGQVLSDIKEISPFLGQVGGSLAVYFSEGTISPEIISCFGQLSLENKISFIIGIPFLREDSYTGNLLKSVEQQNLLGSKLFLDSKPFNWIAMSLEEIISLQNQDPIFKKHLNVISDTSLISEDIPQELRGKTIKEIAENWSTDILGALKQLQEIYSNLDLEVLLPSALPSSWWESSATNLSLETRFINRNNGYTPNPAEGFIYFLSKVITKNSPELWSRYLAKITSQPALLAGLMNRGFLQKDYLADIVIINPDTLRADDSYANPINNSSGIETVIINGHLAWHKGKEWEKGVGELLI
jgi:hypothetical protein